MARNEDRDDRGAADRDLGRQDTDGDDAALQARLAKLSGALDKRRQTQSESDDGNSADSSGQSLGAATNLGLRALVEFVTAVVVGPLIGWQIDTWLSDRTDLSHHLPDHRDGGGVGERLSHCRRVFWAARTVQK